jgi:HAD superfamily hydrolase (TIGR01549 family)
MKPVDTIFFDLDDTLVAFDAVTEKSWVQVCVDFVKHNNTFSSEKLYEVILKHSSWFWGDENRHRKGRLDIVKARREVVISAFNELNLPYDQAVELADQYTKVRINNMYLFPNALEILSFLRNKKFKLALLTNGDSKSQRGKINRFDLEQYFGCIAVEGELGFGKPNKRVFLYALEMLNSQPDSTIMIGDNLKWDIAGPQVLGIRAVWHDWKKTGLHETSEIKPDHTIQSLMQIADILESYYWK